jgi:uncharacterized membrane protein
LIAGGPAGYGFACEESIRLATMPRLNEVLRHLRESLWFVPGLFALGSLLLAAVLVFVDAELGEVRSHLWFAYAGSVQGAREMLSTIATSMLTLTGLVFTVTMLVLQSASNQLSPRVLRTFLRDRGNQVVLGLFVATFLFALVVLRVTRSAIEEGGNELLPGLSIGAAFALLIASIGAFIYYIDHMAQAIRASTVISSIATETRGTIDKLFPEPIGEAPAGEEAETSEVPAARPSALVRAKHDGVIVGLDEEALMKAAGRSEDGDDRFLEMTPLIGDYVPEDAPLFRLWGSWEDDELQALRDAVGFGRERTTDNDAAFGIRQLVDIALRALSPGINDPTTAVQAIDRIHALLRRLGQRQIPSPLRRDPTGKARLYLRRPDWEDYVVLAVEEVRLSGEGQVRVLRRLRQMLFDLLSVVPAERRPPLDQAIERVDRTAQRSLDDSLDRSIARPTDAHGQGPHVG